MDRSAGRRGEKRVAFGFHFQSTVLFYPLGPDLGFNLDSLLSSSSQVSFEPGPRGLAPCPRIPGIGPVRL